MKHIFILILISIIFTGCSSLWVKENPEEDKFNSIPPKPKKKELNEQTKCFYAFKNACLKGNWKIAYGLLSKNWRKRKSLKQFKNNMKKYGNVHLKNAKVLTIVQIKSKKQDVWAITSINAKRNRTMFVLRKEKNNWKIDGVKNLQ